MKTLFILNATPDGHEAVHNSLRLAAALAKRERNAVRIYLMGDGVACARLGSAGAASLEAIPANANCDIGVCGSCMGARSITNMDLIPGAHRGTLEELADWSEWADQILTF
jgi:uncharacterized protein involved in oxidation of intracellular sulfur